MRKRAYLIRKMNISPGDVYLLLGIEVVVTNLDIGYKNL